MDRNVCKCEKLSISQKTRLRFSMCDNCSEKLFSESNNQQQGNHQRNKELNNDSFRKSSKKCQLAGIQ